MKVSVIGLGTYQFGGRWGKAFTKKEASEIIAAAKDYGINLLDTAECYGMNHLSETLVGHAIASSRSHWTLATKFGHEKISPTQNRPAWTTAEVRQQLEASLQALGTDYIDLYQFHSGSNAVFDNDELWEMLDKQKQAGKIRHLGISVSRRSSEWRECQTAQASSVGASVIQVKYNRLGRDAEREVFPDCLTQDLGVLARVPLASGLLSGRYQNLMTFDDSDARAGKYDPQTIVRMQQEIQHIMEHELPESVSLPQYALAWCLTHPAVSCVIPGCKTPEHVQINASVADLSLLDDNHPQALT
jgi:aryl-alcohol dehydrogenase-like predicted oxidoreductase